MHERLDLTIASAGLGTWDYDPATDTLLWDARSREMFGLDADEPIDRDRFLELLCPEDRAGVDAAIERCLCPTGSGEYDQEYGIRLPIGEVRRIRATGRTFFEGEGAARVASRFVGIHLDITDRWQVEEALEEERRAVETLNGIGRALTAEVEPDKILQRVTDEATSLVGAQFGAFFYNVVGDEGEAYMLYTLSGAPREAFERFGMPRNTPIFHPTFSGERIVRFDDVTLAPEYGQVPPHRGMPAGHLPVRSYLAVPVLSSGGGIIGGLFFGHSDTAVFTERHERLVDGIAGWAAIALDNARLVETARAAAARAERAVDLRDEVLAIVSHELRSPLSAILTAGSLVTEFDLGEAQSAKQLRIIRRSSELMYRLVDDLLDAAKIEGARLALDRSPVEVEPLLEDACTPFAQQAAEKGLALTCEAITPLPLIDADRDRVLQALSNIISNAVHHTSTGGVTLHARKEADAVRFSVTDTGTGIPPEDLGHLFERFWQARKAERAGAGLGLAISKGIVEAHGGRIWVESEPGRKTTFHFTIPAARAGHEQP